MEKLIQITDKYLYLPIKKQAKTVLVEFFVEKDGRKAFEFNIPFADIDSEEYHWDYMARFSVEEFIGDALIVRGDVSEAFLSLVKNDETSDPLPQARPLIHFTAENGWINDPNGLVFDDGVYHLYFQYNPFDVQWNNMSWGHAMSYDLLHWKQADDVMYPDEHGLIFSGSAIKNKKGLLDLPKEALIYFYSAAGDGNNWSDFPYFTQRLAYSVDAGMTLTKMEKPCVDVICRDSRDPKVFYHEESNAYIMVLWLEKNDFGILRSEDLKEFELSSKVTLEGAWECPDLLKLTDEYDNEYWVFISADGFYYFGEFDGYEFTNVSEKRQLFFTDTLYASQSYSEITDRTILVPWMRVPNQGDNYTGAMALPRQLSIKRYNGQLCVVQEIVREFYESLNRVDSTEYIGTTYMLRVDFSEVATGRVVVAGMEIIYNRESGRLFVSGKWFDTIEQAETMTIIVDYNLMEIFVDGVISGAFTISKDLLDDKQIYADEGIGHTWFHISGGRYEYKI